MEKKKLKLSISGDSKKTINSIEQAKSQSKNTVVIEKKPPRFGGKPNFSRGTRPIENKSQNSFIPKKTNFSKPVSSIKSDFDRSSMLSSTKVSKTILYMAEQPDSQIIEDLTLMPAGGAF